MLPQITRIFTDFLLLEQQLLADEWMCSPLGIICVHQWNPWEIIYPWDRGVLLFHYLEVFFVYSADGYGIASEVEDELAVAVYADDVAFVVFEWTCEDSQLHVAFGKGLKSIPKECDLFGMCLHHVHKGLHDGVLY